MMCEHNNKPSVSSKDRKCFDQLNYYVRPKWVCVECRQHGTVMRFEYQVTFHDDDDDDDDNDDNDNDNDDNDNDDHVRQCLNQVTWIDSSDHELCNCDFGKLSTLNRVPEETVYKHIYRKDIITTEFSSGPAALVHEVTRKKVLRNGNSLAQRFSNCGPRTTSGPRVPPLWSFQIEHQSKKDSKNKINVNCVSHTIVENLKQSLEITYNKRL